MKFLSIEERFDEVWKHCQRGLVYPSPYAIFVTFWLNKKNISRSRLADVLELVRDKINTDSRLQSRNTTAILGVSFSNWKRICKEEGLSVPTGMKLAYPDPEQPDTSSVFNDSSNTFKDSEGDLWFHIKSNDKDACDLVLSIIVEELSKEAETYFAQSAASKSNSADGHNGKVLGCRFSENLNNPSDPISIAKHTLIGCEDIEHFGGSFVLSQRFLINWSQINAMTEEQIEDLIGRKTNDTIIPDRDSRSHIKSARVQDENGNTTLLLRLGLPFGKADRSSAGFRAPKSVTAADEEGIYFAGFAKKVEVLENIMMNQIGGENGFMNDRLFDHLKSDIGGFFYVPSVEDLDLNNQKYKNDFSSLDKGDWTNFPGVDWTRLDRHFRNASANGLMYYNHQNFLFTMATEIGRKNKFFKVPTRRILSLLENIFRLWQDNWYFNRKQEEIPGDLSHYINQYTGSDKPKEVMDESVMVRKGWAIRLSLQLFSSEEYGFRGRRVLLDDGTLLPYNARVEKLGKVIYGSDTYRISPEEIIVGAMPNLTLGEGRYVMKYLTEQERLDGFLANLSEASGVGHVIPDFAKALEKGLGGLMAEVKAYENNTTDKEKKDLYRASYLALQGISEYCLNYSRLAAETAAKMAPGQKWEKDNLEAIAARMKKLATDKPDTMLEALQLIFTIHSTLHLNGEPTAMGRLDQLLNPFFEKDNISLDEAQEIIDAFYIKLDEKVQQNRIFMEDHQPFGNLAMGGSSGPYPQGASLGQWIQQITVGGTVADGEKDYSKTKPAYNEITRLFIRASGRLPLNAPCLSLRTRKDIPEDLLNEAAHAVLSGGAHPILLNDEKIINGLYHSGDDVGGSLVNDTEEWNPAVEMRSAQNYACDGCYEPQFPGENWFSLGGFSTLQPLECALNQGRTYSSAGQSYLFGKTTSLTTKPADQISSFNELKELYFQHFEWLNRKAFNGQILGFGANTAYCPSPILNVFMDDCLGRGLDFYNGGTKYNIYGPCYISLSSAINSLYAINRMVFDERNAVTTLPELLECLCCDWGYNMTEPFISKLAGDSRISARADRFKRLREIALSLPRYGRGHAEIDAFGNEIVERVATLSIETFTKPWPQFKNSLKNLAKRLGSKQYPFGIQIQPGVGTFENHVEMGAWNGASADGRRNGTSVASDLSAAPSPADLPIDHQYAGFHKSLKGYEGKGADLMSDGAPTDYNIDENYPALRLVDVMKQFTQGHSSNILTITVANAETFGQAVDSPEQFDLLRVRTGGWTNFFTSVFPIIQDQHRRRPVSVPDVIEANELLSESNSAKKVEFDSAAAAAGCPFHQQLGTIQQ